MCRVQVDACNSYTLQDFAGRYISSFTPCSQNEISTEDRKVWSDLTQHQRKQLLKPDKNRNHFKRMWKKDLQIRVLTLLPVLYANACVAFRAEF